MLTFIACLRKSPLSFRQCLRTARCCTTCLAYITALNPCNAPMRWVLTFPEGKTKAHIGEMSGPRRVWFSWVFILNASSSSSRPGNVGPSTPLSSRNSNPVQENCLPWWNILYLHYPTRETPATLTADHLTCGLRGPSAEFLILFHFNQLKFP